MKNLKIKKINISYTQPEVAVERETREYENRKKSKTKNSFCFSGYEYDPRDIRAWSYNDRRRRVVSLVECLEGARLHAYSHQGSERYGIIDGIEVEDYSQPMAVQNLGGIFHVKVPSRTQGAIKHRFDLLNVPMVGGLKDYLSGWRTNVENHNCLRDSYMKIGYSDDGQVYWCAHGVAAYLEVLSQKQKAGNNIPLEMRQLIMPTKEMVEFYKRLLDSVLIEREQKEHRLNKAEKEILLWGLVLKQGFNKTLSGSNVVDYDWGLRN